MSDPPQGISALTGLGQPLPVAGNDPSSELPQADPAQRGVLAASSQPAATRSGKAQELHVGVWKN